MARQDHEHYELTDAEKRDLTKLISEGKPLPEKYRFILFDDKREVAVLNFPLRLFSNLQTMWSLSPRTTWR